MQCFQDVMKTLSTADELFEFTFRGERVWEEGIESGFDAVDDGLMGIKESSVKVEDDELSRHFDEFSFPRINTIAR